MDTCIVKTAHTSTYDDPIVVSKGQALNLTGRTDRWDGHLWLWAIAEDGREGWVPDNLVDGLSRDFTAIRDYSAVELSCVAAESVQILHRSHGWAWCRNTTDNTGWVPLKNLE